MTVRHEFAPVSVVIPCFRCADTISRAVDSIVRQTLMPAEVILVDDASGDGTREALRQLAAAHPGWIRLLFLDKNQGPASARNAGWREATQHYIAFLDADDAWHPDKLRIQHAYMTQHPDVVVSGHRCALMRENEPIPEISEHFRVIRINPVSLIFKSCFSTPTVLIKRDLPFRFTEQQRYAEDLSLWQQIAFSGLPVVRIESPMAYLHKAHYGEAGLSAELWKMEKGELNNLLALYRNGKINVLWLAGSLLFSILKYIRRVVVARGVRCFQ